MAPERAAHVRAKNAVWAALRDAIVANGIDCEALGDGMTVSVDADTDYEPDAPVNCGERTGDDQLYRLTYDGSVAEEHGHVVMGGNSEPLAAYVRERHDPSASLEQVLQLGVEALSQTGPDGAPRSVRADDLEAAVLDRTRPRRAFSRLVGPRLERLLGQETPTA